MIPPLRKESSLVSSIYRIVTRSANDRADYWRKRFDDRTAMYQHIRECNAKNIAEYDRARAERDDARHLLRVRTEERDRLKGGLDDIDAKLRKFYDQGGISEPDLGYLSEAIGEVFLILGYVMTEETTP